MESLKQTLIHTEGQEEEGQKLEELKILSTKVMEQFKTAQKGIEVHITIN